MELLEQVRRGNEAAFTELFVRHRAVARRVALTYRCPGDPDDLVNEAFEKVFAAVRRGSGPTDAFRAYLLVTMRRLAADHAERPQDERLDDVPDAVVAAASGPPLDAEDRELITRAFESLPDRWQAVLWYTAVEGRNPRELAPLLGVSANAVSALAYRAREQLRQAFLQAHLQTWARPQCEPHRSLLGAYVRDGQSRRERASTQRHLDRCQSCQGLVAELHQVNTMLVRSVAPLFPAALIKLAPLAAAAAGGGGGAAGLAALSEAGVAGGHIARRSLGTLAWLKQTATTASGLVAATGLLVGIAGVGAYAARDDSDKPDVAMLTQGESGTTAATTTTAAAPATTAATTQQPCAELISTSTDTPTSTARNRGAGLLGLDIDLPVVSALTGNNLPLTLQDPLCTATGSDSSQLTIGLGPAAGPSGDAPDIAAVDLTALDLNLTVELGTGATAVGVDLPELCEILDGGRQVTCTLDSLLPDSIGLELDTAGSDAGATITVRQGDQTLDVKSVDILGALGELTGPLLGGSTTTP
jgi:RNA polymerase sigma factor (sigma-70 family)